MPDEPPTVPYRPLPLPGMAHSHTLVAAFLRLPLRVPAARRTVALEDGDALALLDTVPPGWRPGGRTVVLVHGLCGCEASPYMLRLARKLHERGVRAVRLNLRGCGSGFGLARGIYHSGRSGDVRAVLESLRAEHPPPRVALVGFSLGGNLALKLAGELGAGASRLFNRVVGVCPPADLEACARLIHERQNRIYERHFVKQLSRDALRRHARFPDLPPPALPGRPTLWSFDDVYTAPRAGYGSALEYYRDASAAPHTPRIRVPCHVLFARDDPFIAASALDPYPLPDTVRVVRVPRGGHLGFLGLPRSPGGYHWMDRQIIDWVVPEGRAGAGAPAGLAGVEADVDGGAAPG